MLLSDDVNSPVPLGRFREGPSLGGSPCAANSSSVCLFFFFEPAEFWLGLLKLVFPSYVKPICANGDGLVSAHGESHDVTLSCRWFGGRQKFVCCSW